MHQRIRGVATYARCVVLTYTKLPLHSKRLTVIAHVGILFLPSFSPVYDCLVCKNLALASPPLSCTLPHPLTSPTMLFCLQHFVHVTYGHLFGLRPLLAAIKKAVAGRSHYCPSSDRLATTPFVKRIAGTCSCALNLATFFFDCA